MEQKYVITDGKNYISSTNTGVTIVGNIMKARRFTYEKANNFLRSLPKTMKKFDFVVEEYKESDENVISDRYKVFHQMQEEDEAYSNLMDGVLSKSLDFENYIISLQKYDKYIDIQMEVLKRALRDAEHKFELENLDMYTSWQVGKDIQKIQQRRRKLKNDQEIIKYIMSQKIENLSFNIVSNFIKEKETSEPTYKARYLDYLFEK